MDTPVAPGDPDVAPAPAPARSLFRRLRPWLAIIGFVIAATALLGYESLSTRPVREAARSFAELISLGDRSDLGEDELKRQARLFCSEHYLATHDPRPAPEGGLIGLPRTLHPDYKAWREGDDVWIRPTARAGPVYQFVYEAGRWKFDGPVGILTPQGEFIPASKLEPESRNQRGQDSLILLKTRIKA